MVNVLLVDDQKLVIDDLLEHVRWSTLPVGELFTARSATEARLFLLNHKIDLMITDIEMPEESGIDLARWVRDRGSNLLIAFLTTHSEFDYARQGVQLQIMDYIMQPVRYEELEDCIRRADRRQETRNYLDRLDAQRQLNELHENALYDSIISRILYGSRQEAEKLFRTIEEKKNTPESPTELYLIYLTVEQWMSVRKKVSDSELREAFRNAFTELFEEEDVSCGIAGAEEGRYFVFLTLRKDSIKKVIYRRRIEEIAHFFERREMLNLIVAADDTPVGGQIAEPVLNLIRRGKQDRQRSLSVRWEDSAEDSDYENGMIEEALAYIRKNIYRKLSRTEVADHVHLNPEYFSRLFHKRTGLSFKEYVIQEKMEKAAELLIGTHLSIGVIASKIEFESVSHFSQSFKNKYELSPQDFRKKYQKTP